MSQEHLPVEEIDSHVETHLSKFSELESQQKMIDLCEIWTAVRPIVKFARALLFWKPKWQSVVDRFITALDEDCGQV